MTSLLQAGRRWAKTDAGLPLILQTVPDFDLRGRLSGVSGRISASTTKTYRWKTLISRSLWLRLGALRKVFAQRVQRWIGRELGPIQLALEAGFVLGGACFLFESTRYPALGVGFREYDKSIDRS